jgi:hypothetical protein
MAYRIIPDLPEKKEKRFHIKAPDISGKFGFSINLGKKEIFLGLAIATIEMESITRKRKRKALSSLGDVKVVNF